LTTEHQGRVKVIEKNTTTSTKELSNTLGKFNTFVEAHTEDWLAEVHESSRRVKGFCSSCSLSASEVTEQVENFSLQSYQPTTDTPSKRVITYPQQLTKTRPESEILAQYRNGGSPLSETTSESQASSPYLNLENCVSSFVSTESESDSLNPLDTEILPSSSLNKTKLPIKQSARPIPHIQPKGRGPVRKPTTRRIDFGRENPEGKKGAKLARSGEGVDSQKQTVQSGHNTAPVVAVVGRESQRTRLGDLTNQVK